MLPVWANPLRAPAHMAGMTKYRKGAQRTTKDPQRTAKQHYTGPQRIGNHEKTAKLATILFNFLKLFCLFFVFFL